MKRSLKQEHKSWQIYKKWQKEHASEIREGQWINSLGEFKEVYNQSGRNLRKVEYFVRFQTSYATFNAINKQYREDTGKSLRREMKKMSTKDLAAFIQSDIEDYRTQLKNAINPDTNERYTAAEIAKKVSTYFFGS